MKTLNEILRDLQSENLYESQEDKLVKEILKEIDKWLEDETKKQNWIETNLRSKRSPMTNLSRKYLKRLRMAYRAV